MLTIDPSIEYVCDFPGSGRCYYFDIVEDRGVGWGKVMLKRIEPMDDERVGQVYTFRYANIRYTYEEHRLRRAMTICFILGQEKSKVTVTAWQVLSEKLNEPGTT